MHELPHWFMAIGTGQILAIVGWFGTMSMAMLWLVVVHRDPMKYGIGTAKSEAQNQEILKTQKLMHKRISQQLHIALWQSFESAKGNGEIERFPVGLRALLESEILLEEGE